MKFFTQSWSDKDAEHTAVYQSYLRYLEKLREVLPPNVLELATLPGLHDSLIVEVRYDRGQRILILILRCGHTQMDYYDLVLRYEDAEITPSDEQLLAQIAYETKDGKRTDTDLDQHEVDVTEDGRIEHRLLFHPYRWFAIRCQKLQWNKISRPNRDLAVLNNRFLNVAINE